MNQDLATVIKKLHFRLSGLLVLLGASSCTTDDGPQSYQPGTNEYANGWAYQQMNKYYFWNDSMPGEGNLASDPAEYFKGLLVEEDRFSYALHPALPDSYPKSLSRSFGFDMDFIDHQGQVYGVILYALSGSPAERSGLRRGLYVRSVGGIAFSHQNFERLYDELAAGGIARLEVMEFDPVSGFSPVRPVSISQGFTLLQPLVRRIIEQGNDKIGYIGIPHFDTGLAQSLVSVFQEFRSRSVNKLVVDLRYNGGGDVSSAAALCAIIAPDVHPDDHFITFKGNRNGGTISQSFRQALEMNEQHVSFQALRAVSPTIQKLFILCGRHTASASEIIINNMKPFMEVVTIGEKTMGKDVAGFAIKDERVPGQAGWTLYPSIYKLFNAAGQGSYSTGIAPTIALDELDNLQIHPLGDPRETLLQKAIEAISANRQSPHLRKEDIIPLRRRSADEGYMILINP